MQDLPAYVLLNPTKRYDRRMTKMTKRVKLKNLLIEFESITKEFIELNHLSNTIDGNELEEIVERLVYIKNVKEWVFREIFKLFEE